MEFAMVISNPGEGQWLQHIDWNREEIEAQIREAVKDYQNVAYGEDQIKQAKTDRVALNKLRKEIDDRRKAVKKVVNAPYDQFEKEVREVLSIVDEASSQIDQQVKAYEEKQREEKRTAYMEYFHSALGDLDGRVDPEKLLNRSWDNTSVSMKKIHEEIDAKVKMIRSDLEYISGLEDDERAVADAEYQRAYDLGSTLAAVNRFKSARKENEERKIHENGAEAAQRLINRFEGHEPDELSAEAEKTQEEALENRIVASKADDAPADVPESRKGEPKKGVSKLEIAFTGWQLQILPELLKKNRLSSRGMIKLEVLGTPDSVRSFIGDLQKSGIRVGGAE